MRCWWGILRLTVDKKPLKDHMEAVGHKEAFDFVRDLVKEQVPLSERVIQQIHYLIFPRLARFYIAFEGIHPFVDRNRRTGSQA